MMYAVKEIFRTVQGEGYHAGTPAVFVRFAGCNLWSGEDATRARDAERNGARCPLFCDTDFRGHDAMRKMAHEVAATVERIWGQEMDTLPLIVMTGGEPLLQVDPVLIAALDAMAPLAVLAVETNGTVEIPYDLELDWVCVSPKVPVERIVVRGGRTVGRARGSEIKVVVPDYNPLEYEPIAYQFEHRWVSACADTSSVGKSLINADNLRRAAEFCIMNPSWRLTAQLHKIVGVP